MRIRRIVVTAVLIVCGVTAQAQQMPTGKWWRRPEVIQELQLSNDQQDRLDEVFREAANGLIDDKGAVEKLQIAIRDELDRKPMRRNELQRIAARLSEARGRLFERELMMLVDMRGVLDEQQWRRLRSRLEAQRERAPQQRQLPRRQRPR